MLLPAWMNQEHSLNKSQERTKEDPSATNAPKRKSRFDPPAPAPPPLTGFVRASTVYASVHGVTETVTSAAATNAPAISSNNYYSSKSSSSIPMTIDKEEVRNISEATNNILPATIETTPTMTIKKRSRWDT